MDPDDIVTLRTLRSQLMATAQTESRQYYGFMHPMCLSLFWSPGTRLKVLQMWWNMRPWRMHDETAERHVIAWLECRPWRVEHDNYDMLKH